MFDSIMINNFQSWKNVFLKLSPGVNAIVGPSDSGKTAIFRAINLVTNNRPGGDEFRSWWGGDTAVSIDLEEGKIIERIKSDKLNCYNLIDSKGNTETFKGFGQKVPAEIQKLLNLSEINFRFQHDGPFLLGQSPGANARYLNNVVNLDIIDTALYNINKQLREEDWKLRSAKEEKQKQQEKLKEFEWLPDAEKVIKKAEQFERELNKLKNDYTELESLHTELKEVEQELIEINKVVKFERKIDELIIIDEEIDGLIDDEEELTALNSELLSAIKNIGMANHFIKHESKVNQVLKLSESISQDKETYVQIKNIFRELKQKNLDLASYERAIKDVKKEFDELMKEKCPLCGRG